MLVPYDESLGTTVEPDPLAEEERSRAGFEIAAFANSAFRYLLQHGYETSDALDAIIDHPTYVELTDKLKDALKRAPVRAPKVPSHERWAAARRDETTGAVLTKAAKLLQAIHDASARIRHSASNKFESITSEEDQRRNLLWFMSDPLVPADVADARLAAVRTILEVQLLDTFEHLPFSEAALQQLAALFVEDLMAYLRLLASIPDAGVPESLVPTCDRLSLDALFERQRKVREALESLAREADATGKAAG